MRLKNVSLSYSVEVFKSLSEEARVRIINLLREKKEMCIVDLELVLGFTQAKASRHVTYLKNAGILGSKRVDSFVFYYIKDDAIQILDQIFVFIQKDPQLKKDMQDYETLFSNRELAINKLESKRWLYGS